MALVWCRSFNPKLSSSQEQERTLPRYKLAQTSAEVRGELGRRESIAHFVNTMKFTDEYRTDMSKAAWNYELPQNCNRALSGRLKVQN
jgi:hypothetical protein